MQHSSRKATSRMLYNPTQMTGHGRLSGQPEECASRFDAQKAVGGSTDSRLCLLLKPLLPSQSHLSYEQAHVCTRPKVMVKLGMSYDHVEVGAPTAAMLR